MSRRVIRAQYNTENSFCTGYICIKNKQIEGVFGDDYMKIFQVNGILQLQLIESKLHRINGKFLRQRKSSVFVNSGTHCSEFSPRMYHLFYAPHAGIALTLEDEITDEKEKKAIFEQLKLVTI